MNTVQSARSSARWVAYSPAVETIARIGYAIRGVLYILIGLLAVRLIIGPKGQQPTPQGALQTLAQQPAGHVLLWIVFIGLLAYAFWCLVQFLFNPLHRPGFGARIWALVNTLSYGFLAWTAYGFVKGTAGASGGSQSKFMGQLMVMPAGRYLIGLIGIIVIIVGIGLMMRGINGTFEREFDHYRLTRDEARIARQTGRLGTFAQGLVLAIIGILIFYAAYTSNAGQSVGMNTVFTTLMSKPYGPVVVIVIGLGLIAFGIYSLMAAAWFRLRRNS